MKALLLLTAGLLLSAPAMALDVGTRHETGRSWSTYEGKSRTKSTTKVDGHTVELSGSGASATNRSSGGFRFNSEDYSHRSTTRSREDFKGGFSSEFSESSTFSR